MTRSKIISPRGSFLTLLVALTGLGLRDARPADASAPRGRTAVSPVAAQSKVIKEQVVGGIAFPPEKRMWTQISGKVKVINAFTLVFEDGTEVDLRWNMDAPDLEQKGLIGDSFYPAGQQAAEFLRKLIGRRAVTFFGNPRTPKIEGAKELRGPCFVGETSLELEMVRNGWAISQHTAVDAYEIFARENKRGLWRGQFVVPEKWRKGERLLGETVPAQDGKPQATRGRP